MYFEDWIEGDLVLGFSAVGFLTRIVISLAFNFFVLESGPLFAGTLVALFGLVYFEDWIERLGFRLFDEWLFNQTCYLFSCQFFYTRQCSSFHKNLSYTL